MILLFLVPRSNSTVSVLDPLGLPFLQRYKETIIKCAALLGEEGPKTQSKTTDANLDWVFVCFLLSSLIVRRDQSRIVEC